MPGFIKTPADEARWDKAKEAANKSHSESEGNSYWKIVNSIYQKMAKSDESIEEVMNALKKARQKLSDEYDPNDMGSDEEGEDLGEGYREFDPDEEESAGSDWLKENDPENKGEQYDEYGDDEDEDAHQKAIQEDLGDEGEDSEVDQPQTRGQESGRAQKGNPPQPTIKEEDSPEEVAGKRSRFQQPSREDLMALRA